MYAFETRVCVWTGRTRTGSAKQLVAGGTGAAGVRVGESNAGKAVVVAAPRSRPVWRVKIAPSLPGGGSRVTARVGGLDPHGARRALIAARGTGLVRACTTHASAAEAQPAGSRPTPWCAKAVDRRRARE